MLFQSTPPVKAATVTGLFVKIYFKFQSTPPVKAATEQHAVLRPEFFISIHAAREGGDQRINGLENRIKYFNPRRP